jgi:hypothetical protein
MHARAAAEAVVVHLGQLDESGHPHVDDLSDDGQATIKVPGHEHWSFVLSDSGWATVLHTPVDDDPDHCTAIDGFVDDLDRDAGADEVAHCIFKQLAGDELGTGFGALNVRALDPSEPGGVWQHDVGADATVTIRVIPAGVDIFASSLGSEVAT